jgi:N-acyl-D-aspartate/D-glutamate deacylase
MQHDLVIRGGTVVDGRGTAPRTADVAIDGGRITAVGRLADAKGRSELDADGLLVTPGWVDIHTHYDGQVTWDPELTPSSWHGVTTAVMGNCGVGFAPVAPDKHEWLINLMEGVEDIPGTALHEGISWGWETFPEYLDVIDRMPRVLDIGAQIPHAALRGYVMGDRGADHAAEPTTEEIARMAQLVEEGIRAGALGFSTSRSVAHKSADGRYTPSLTAGAAEMLGIAEGLRRAGAGVLEIVADLVDLDAEFALYRRMCDVSGRPMSITTLQRAEFPPDEYQRILQHISDAVRDGLDMRGQVAARPVGLIMSLDGRINPLLPSPTYQQLLRLPVAARVVEMRKSEVREKVLAELDAAPAGANPMSRFPYVFVMDGPGAYASNPDDDISRRAQREGVSPWAVAYDTLIAHDGRGALVVPVNNFASGTQREVREMLTHPLTVPGLGDAGAHCTMICDGSFPTYLASYWARDARADDRLPIEWVVQRQCAMTAEIVGLHDRGVLAPGYRADINLIDFDRLTIDRPEMLYDLPAAGKRLVQRAQGYVATLVQGEVTFRDGRPTGARPGALVRGAQPAPAA